MSLPSPSPYSRIPGNIEPRKLSPKEQEAWDAPYMALAQKSGGDLRLLLQSLFSFLHRKTDFYIAHNPMDVKEGIPVQMGFKEGDAEKLLLASFRQYPLRRLPRMSDIRQKQQLQQAKPKEISSSSTDSSATTAATTTTTNTKMPTPKQTKNEKVSNNNIDDKNNSSTAPSAQNTTKVSSKKENQTSSTSTPSPSLPSSNVRYTEEGKQIPIGNGGTSLNNFNYQWTQTIQEVSIALPLPPQTRAKNLDVKIKHDSIVVQLKTLATESSKSTSNDDQKKKNENDDSNSNLRSTSTSPSVLLKGKLKNIIRTDESTWTIENNVLLIILDKKDRTWWDEIVVSTDKDTDTSKTNRNIIDTALIDSTSKISEYDHATQGMIRKVLFDQRQDRLGLPKSDDILREEAVAKMMNGETDIIPPTPPSTLGSISSSMMISRDNIPPLPPGVEYIDKTNFPPSNKR